MKHTEYKCENLEGKTYPHEVSGHCQFCDGGLGACTVCNGAEGTLPSDCPGVKMSQEQQDQVYHGVSDPSLPDGKLKFLNFKEGKGWHFVTRWDLGI